MSTDDLEFSSPAPGVVRQNHAPRLCAGEYCVIHNPSGHHMNMWPTVFRSDQRHLILRAPHFGKIFVLTERICPHGIGHPDPDSLAYARRVAGDEFVGGMGIHGCDGCCHA